MGRSCFGTLRRRSLRFVTRSPKLIRLEPLNEQELQAAVIARHRLSGFEHSFDRGDGSPIEGLFARGARAVSAGPTTSTSTSFTRRQAVWCATRLRLWLASIRDKSKTIS